VSINANRRVALLYLVLDLIAVIVVFNVVIYLRISAPQLLFWSLLAPAFVFTVSLYLIDGYGSQTDMLSVDYASMHLIASVAAALVTLFLTFAIVPEGFELRSSRAAILLSFAIIGPASLGYRRIKYERNVAARELRNLVFVGTNADFEAFSSECERLRTGKPLIHVSKAENYAALEAILDSIASSTMQVEAIVIKESVLDLPSDVPMKLVQFYFAGVPTYTLEIFHQVYWRKIPLYRINPTWLFQEGFQVAREPVFERVKRASDIVLAVLGLTLSAPLIGAAAIAIKLEDGGTIFFKQRRIGRHRVGFQLAKLRTMRESKGIGDLYTRQGDTRITFVGKILRAARLDELPQLWNVLRGDMSLIGPRAEWDKLVENYEKEIPSYHFRHLVKPGITGWAQVNYRYGVGIEDTLRKLEYDLYYIRSFSFMLDASIVLKTLHVMLFQKGR
jgi:lipopolysaccharide/colanic/teichoic acid biosynthesis glycosyltransferase